MQFLIIQHCGRSNKYVQAGFSPGLHVTSYLLRLCLAHRNYVIWTFALSDLVSSSRRWAWQPLQVGVNGRNEQLGVCQVPPAMPGTKEVLTGLGLVHPLPKPSSSLRPYHPSPQGLAWALSQEDLQRVKTESWEKEQAGELEGPGAQDRGGILPLNVCEGVAQGGESGSKEKVQSRAGSQGNTKVLGTKSGEPGENRVQGIACMPARCPPPGHLDHMPLKKPAWRYQRPPCHYHHL